MDRLTLETRTRAYRAQPVGDTVLGRWLDNPRKVLTAAQLAVELCPADFAPMVLEEARKVYRDAKLLRDTHPHLSLAEFLARFPAADLGRAALAIVGPPPKRRSR